MSGKVYARAVFDRKKEIAKKGFGKVEIRIVFSPSQQKCVTIAKCSALEWRAFKNSPELQMRVAMYNDIANQMAKHGEEMTLDNLNAHLEIQDTRTEKRKKKDALSSPTSFIDFMRECIKKKKNAPKTLSRKEQVIRYLEEFGLIKVHRLPCLKVQRRHLNLIDIDVVEVRVEVLCKQSVTASGCRAAGRAPFEKLRLDLHLRDFHDRNGAVGMKISVVNLAVQEQSVKIAVLPIDMPEDVDVLLAATERERDAQRIRVRTCKETILRDKLEGRIPLQHGGLSRNDDAH